MSLKTLSWILLAATTIGAVLLLNYWASYQLLSTLAYVGMVAALLGLANLALPFRFLGVRKRALGALILAAGIALTIAALLWPAATIRVTEPKTVLDNIMPEYQFSEIHSARIRARPAQVMQSVRESTWGDMKSLRTLLKIRGASLHTPSHASSAFSQDKRILDAFAASGYVSGGSDHEIVMCGGVNVRSTSSRLAPYRNGLIFTSRLRSRRPLISTWQMRAADGPPSPPKRVSWRLTISPAAAWPVTGD